MEPTSNGSQQPTPAAAGPTPDPLEAFKDPQNNKFFGKWESPDEAKKGMSELLNYASNVKTENETLKALISEGGRMDPGQRAADRHDPLKEIETLIGTSVDPLRQMARAEAQQIAKQTFEPILKTIEARTRMASEVPEYVQHEGAVMKFVNANPALAETFNSIAAHDPYAGLRYGYAMWRESAAPRTQDAGTEAAKAAAALPNGSGNASVTRTAVGPDAQQQEAALREALRTRDPASQADFFASFLGDRPLLWGEKGGS